MLQRRSNSGSYHGSSATEQDTEIGYINFSLLFFPSSRTLDLFLLRHAHTEVGRVLQTLSLSLCPISAMHGKGGGWWLTEVMTRWWRETLPSSRIWYMMLQRETKLPRTFSLEFQIERTHGNQQQKNTPLRAGGLEISSFLTLSSCSYPIFPDMNLDFKQAFFLHIDVAIYRRYLLRLPAY